MDGFFVDEHAQSNSADSSRIQQARTAHALPVVKPFLGYWRQELGVVGSSLYVATFLPGTMSGSGSFHKCPVLDGLHQYQQYHPVLLQHNFRHQPQYSTGRSRTLLLHLPRTKWQDFTRWSLQPEV